MTNFAVFAFDDETAPAARLAAKLNVPVAKVAVHRFPDGETMPRVKSPAPDVAILYRSLDKPNAKLVNLLLAADAIHRAGARKVILVAPYFCYLRQDAVFAPGESLSRDVIGPMIGRSFDGVITVQAHLHRTHDLTALLGVPAVNLIPIEPLAAALPSYESPPLVLGPDQESATWVESWVKRLGGQSVTLRKSRYGDRDVAMNDNPLVEARGRAVVIVDDIASSGMTLTKALQRLHSAGAASVDIAIAHAMTTPGMTQSLMRAGARRIVSTDSIKHSTNAAFLAPILAEAALNMSATL